MNIVASKKHSLSVFIITQNEVDRLPLAIQAIQGIADEIVVVDSGSTDGTLEIAKDSGAKVYYNEWQGYAVQKSFAASKCSHEWILNIDADEEISSELAQSILSILEQDNPVYHCFNMRITTLFPGEKKPGMFNQGFNVIRLYNKNYAGIDGSLAHNVDDRIKPIKPDEKIGQLEGEAYHRSIRDISSLVAKSNAYTDQQAALNLEKHRNFSILRLYLEFPLALIRYLFLKGYILRGWYGFTVALTYAFQRFVRISKTREKFLMHRH